MKKIESNEENLATKKKKQLRNHPILWGIGTFVLLSSFSTLILLGGWKILLFARTLFKWTKTIKIVSALALMLGWGGGTAFFTVKVLKNRINNITRKNSQQNHSDLDTDENHQQIEKEEKKKHQQSKGLKKIEKQDQKYLLALPPNAEEMTAEEIADLLNQEIEFWNPVEFEKNYGDRKEKIKVKKQDQKYLLALPPNAEEMTAEEIADFLNQEIEFWNPVEFEKNYGDRKEKIKVKKH